MIAKRGPGPELNLTAERLTSLYEHIGRMNSVHGLHELLFSVIDRALNLTGGKQAVLQLGESRRPSRANCIGPLPMMKL